MLALAAASAVAACGSAGQPVAPTEITADIGGEWVGTASDSTGPGQLTWHVSQTGASFTGTVTMIDTATSVAGRGALSGTVSGLLMHFSLSVPAGGFDGPYDRCAADVSGDGKLSGATLDGTYSGVNSCTGKVTAGQFTMTRP